MEPEITAPSGSKNKFLISAIVVILAVVGVALGYLFMQKDTPGPVAEVLVKTETPREPTEAEKLLKSQIDELDSTRGQWQTQSTTTLQSQIKSLEAIKKTTVSKIAPKTIEQQAQELDAIRATLNK